MGHADAETGKRRPRVQEDRARTCYIVPNQSTQFSKTAKGDLTPFLQVSKVFFLSTYLCIPLVLEFLCLISKVDTKELNFLLCL
ncbi:hypothetical protein CMV_002596 [Castanea mollissima]|uniref:Uncharacterized protein n=1 Tax=Castanea mollissima TaxID=60419 RepID=A0A8J4S1K3_9ROSI|nr:hypothetical protein CMV_002596 [Castanea mollissima]